IGPNGSDAKDFFVADNFAYFSAQDMPNAPGLWRTDGMPAGTIPISMNTPVSFSLPGPFLVIGGRLLFAAADDEHGYELLQSDGTSSGTSLLIDINPGPASSYPASLTVLDGVAYFRATTPGLGAELWRSDGTPGGTYLAQDIIPGPASSNPGSLFAANGKL